MILYVIVNIFMIMSHALVGRTHHRTETWLFLYNKTKKRRKKWPEIMRRQGFISVTSTGYKSYFNQFCLMWSYLRKNILNEQNSQAELKRIWFESLFYCVYLCKDTWWMNTFFKLQGCQGERLSTRKSKQKIQQQACFQSSDFIALYIVFETVEYQHIYC